MKTFIKIVPIALMVTLGHTKATAQQVPMYTHYMYNTLVVNPAYAGSRDALTITALHRSQWVGVSDAPTTQTLTMHTPLRNQHIGLGLAVMKDKVGPISNLGIVGDFAYRMQLTKKAKLALGMSMGADIFQANLNTLATDQQNDPAFANNINNATHPIIGFGMYYSRERFYAGVSVPNLVQSSYSSDRQANGTTLAAKDQRHYFFIAGTVLKISDNLEFKPTTLVKVTEAAPIQADLTASFIIVKKLLVGAMFRSGDAAGALVGLDITQQLHVGYSYDWSYGFSTSNYNQGSHEIMLRYDFIFFDKKQIHNPRYF
jgi:type IX secretion system PorP/SprF family membrane protein